MKKCPFCAEEIQDEAIKCRHCGSMLEAARTKWYFRTSILIVAFLSVGPLALPLLWFNPRYSTNAKIIWTAIIAIAGFYLIMWTADAMKSISSYYQTMQAY